MSVNHIPITDENSDDLLDETFDIIYEDFLVATRSRQSFRVRPSGRRIIAAVLGREFDIAAIARTIRPDNPRTINAQPRHVFRVQASSRRVVAVVSERAIAIASTSRAITPGRSRKVTPLGSRQFNVASSSRNLRAN